MMLAVHAPTDLVCCRSRDVGTANAARPPSRSPSRVLNQSPRLSYLATSHPWDGRDGGTSRQPFITEGEVILGRSQVGC